MSLNPVILHASHQASLAYICMNLITLHHTQMTILYLMSSCYPFPTTIDHNALRYKMFTLCRLEEKMVTKNRRCLLLTCNLVLSNMNYPNIVDLLLYNMNIKLSLTITIGLLINYVPWSKTSFILQNMAKPPSTHNQLFYFKTTFIFLFFTSKWAKE